MVRSIPSVPWVLRILWLSLPLVAGPAAEPTLDAWASGTRALAASLLWSAWAVVLVGLLAPRPAALTALRLVAGGFAAAAVTATATADPGPGALEAGAAIGSTLGLAGASLLPEVGEFLVNGVAYGDERRFLLRPSRPVGWVALPLAVLLAAGGASAGPLLLADGGLGLGLATCALGLPVAALLTRSVHSLSRRWLVQVPGGLVVHDAHTLADPVLLPRDRIAAVTPVPPVPAGSLDLRLGARGPALAVSLREAVSMPVLARPSRDVEMVQATCVVVAPQRPGAVLERLAVRHRAR